ncbi:MAG TPA: AarF/UbiB family protein [Oligoflexus sp.]|uniref:ABC1 kinase family protein n=1 Tax=Oligoflexus sp. TaxID=1971216 RepID=UPI002D394B75|nr:AarF/UbiB family protein [Oligoflexus sp.]HYX36176.1 AarF/UbiB family protein [Oligoflexus sp.]
MTSNTTDKEPFESINNSLLGVAARDLKRLQAIFLIITRHGFGELFLRSPIGKIFFGQVKVEGQSDRWRDQPAAIRFRRLLEELGPTYIKFGQIMSMRPDIMPASYITALEGLQDQTPPVAFEAIRDVVERSLGRPLSELFAEFSQEPLATASIAQTHRAVTKSGESVIVKVQRPQIEQTMRGDLDLLFMLTKALEVGIEEMRLLAPSEIVAEFEISLLRELDFNEELGNLETARTLLVPERSVVVPKPFPELSSRHVLTMEFFPGQSLRRIKPQTPEAKHAVTEILHAACKQVLIDGFFHGDPHAGNILINEAGVICMIDLGLVGHLRDDQRADIVTLIIAAISRDAGTIARVFLRMGTPLKRINLNEFKAEITRILDRYMNVKAVKDFKSQELADEFVNAAQRFQIKLASEYSILTKASLTIEGLIRNLYPDINAIEIAQPYIQRLMAERLNPRTLMTDSMSTLTGLSSMLKQLPTQLDQILHDAETGNLQVRAMNPQLELLPMVLHHLGSRLALAAFAMSMSLAAALLIAIRTPDRPLSLLIATTLVSAAFAWFILFCWHFVRTGQPYRARSLLQFFRR